MSAGPDPAAAPARASARLPRRGDELEVDVDAFDGRGRGTGSASGCRVSVRGAIPGDRVRARVLRRRGRAVEAALVSKLAASAAAVHPRCAHFGSCGGCSLQDLEYFAQLAGLARLVDSAFRARGLLDGVEVEPVLPAPGRWAYRNRMEFTFGSRRWIGPEEPEDAPGDAPEGFALGLHAAGLHSKVVDVRACPIQDPRADAILDHARAIAIERRLEPWDHRSRSGLLRHLGLRVSLATGEVLVNLVTSELADEAVRDFARALLDRQPGITTIVQTVNARPAATSQGDFERVLHGPGTIRESLGGLDLAISASSFFQTNTAAAEVLLRLVREAAALRGDEVVWDLYCGTGTLALALAREAREVLGFEVHPASVADARANAARNGIANARFLEGDVLESTASAALPAPGVIVVDPPRAGLHPRIVGRIVSLSPERLVYVSCNPASAAADLERLVPWGWRIRRIRPLDLFPHTPHVECVVTLGRDHAAPGGAPGAEVSRSAGGG